MAKTNKKPDPKKKGKTIITDDPNDKGLQMYRDSMTLYKKSIENLKFLNEKVDPLLKEGKEDEADELFSSIHRKGDTAFKKAYKNLTKANKEKPKGKDVPSEYSDGFGVYLYDKPVNKVTYKPKKEKELTPIVEKPQIPKMEVPQFSKMENGKRLAISEEEYKNILNSGNVTTNRTGTFLDKETTVLKKFREGGPMKFSDMNLKDLNIDELLGGVNLIADLTGSAINSIKGEYDIAALNKQTNPYFARKGGNVSGAKEFKAPSHEDGGLGITADGAVSNNPDAEIEKDEILYKFRTIPEGDYVFSSANGTASKARAILDKYRINSTTGKTQDIDNDSLTRAKMEMELKAVVDKNEAMNAKSLAAEFIQRCGGRVKKMPYGGPIDPLDLESTQLFETNLTDEWGRNNTSEMRTLQPENMRANTAISYDPSADTKKTSMFSNIASNLGGSKGALARGSAVFLDALDMLKKPLKEQAIIPDFGPADAAMRSLSADLTEAEQGVYSGYNAATEQNRNMSNSLQQLSARQQGLAAGMTDSMMKIAAQKRAMLNQIAEKQATYEAGKAGTIAQAKYQNRVDNLQNEAARQQFVERARDNMIQIGANLDKMDIVQKQTAEGNKLLASYGNYFNVEFDANGNPSEVRIKVDR